ncbi:MAG: M56 family metallopeptidase [Lachnospiraceae bacterium]|nr:M56 family metallopeptidase [Lachnospiraceae bacterium]
MSLLQMSFSGAALIFVIAVIRAVAIHKLPKKTFLILWGISLLRLLVPFSIPSMFSVYSFVERNTDISKIIPIMPGGTIEETFAKHLPSASIWPVIWCIGTVLCIMLFILLYLHWYFEFQTSLPVHSSYMEQWLKTHELNRPLCIKQSEKITSPLTYGIFRPVIVMPKDTEWENLKQLQYILMHEYVHICRYDTAIKLISALALCIHWFNPLVWVMYILLNRDIELSCDESVVHKLGLSEKATYANMLIGMEAKKIGFIPFCNGFNKNAIEERITAIMRMKKPSKLTLLFTCLAVIGVTCVFATSAGAKENVSTTDTSVTNDIPSGVIHGIGEPNAEELFANYPDSFLMIYHNPSDEVYDAASGWSLLGPATSWTLYYGAEAEKNATYKFTWGGE